MGDGTVVYFRNRFLRIPRTSTMGTAASTRTTDGRTFGSRSQWNAWGSSSVRARVNGAGKCEYGSWKLSWIKLQWFSVDPISNNFEMYWNHLCFDSVTSTSQNPKQNLWSTSRDRWWRNISKNSCWQADPTFEGSAGVRVHFAGATCVELLKSISVPVNTYWQAIMKCDLNCPSQNWGLVKRCFRWPKCGQGRDMNL